MAPNDIASIQGAENARIILIALFSLAGEQSSGLVFRIQSYLFFASLRGLCCRFTIGLCLFQSSG
jgi:hypothetical protein